MHLDSLLDDPVGYLPDSPVMPIEPSTSSTLISQFSGSSEMTSRPQSEAFLASAYPATEIGFSVSEYRQRHSRIRMAMATVGIDVLFLSAPEAICYATGYQAE